MIERVESAAVHFKLRERAIGEPGIHSGSAFHGGKVANAAEQPTCHPRRSARAARDLMRAFWCERQREQPRPAPHDLLELRHVVEFEPDRNTEPLPERCGEEPGARRGADQGEAREVDTYRARSGSLADNEIELKVLHRRIEDFLDRGI